MKNLNFHEIRYQVLRACYKLAPFNIKGGWVSGLEAMRPDLISCLVISSQRSQDLDMLLEDLSCQTISKDRFEVIILNDIDPQAYDAVIRKYEKCMNIRFFEVPKASHMLSNLRNMTLERSCGEFILFLDDDTRIFQTDFLSQVMRLFKEDKADVIVPSAHALYGIRAKKYDFLDNSAIVTRCCLYTRSSLESIGGFLENLTAYEDIELSIRMNLKGCKVLRTSIVNYFHPPHYFDSMRKPFAIGQSIFQMKRQYSWLVWVCVYLNSLRFLVYGVIPVEYCRQWFKISWGVLTYPFVRKRYHY